jgi:hypothetical protein
MSVRNSRPARKRPIKHRGKARSAKPRVQDTIGNLQINDSTKPSGIPSRPVTRYRSFKMSAAASCTNVDTETFTG